MSSNDNIKAEEFDYRNLPNLDDDSEENIKMVDEMMEFFYRQAIAEKAEKEQNK